MRYQEMHYGDEQGFGYAENYEEYTTFGNAVYAFLTDLELFSPVNGTVVLGCEATPIVSVDFRDGHIVSIY